MFGLVLRHLREQAGMSLRELGRRALYDHTRISRAEKGEFLVPPEQAAALDTALNAGGLLLRLRHAADTPAGMARGGEPVMLDVQTPDGRTVHVALTPDHISRLLASGSANRRDALRLSVAALAAPALFASDGERLARELTRHSEETDIGPSTLDQLRHVIGEYGHHYARYPAGDLWRSALADRRRVAELMQLRMTLRQRRDLYVAAGWLSVILAWSAHDQGDDRAAIAYAADARHHAGEADNDEVVAWARDVEATVWFYDGRPNPNDALHAAEHGAQAAPPGSAAHIRLTGQLARIHAQLGHADATAQALTGLREQAETQPLHAPGLFTADTARILSITATSHLHLRQDEQAARYALQALGTYDDAPAASPTRRAITRLDLATACARLGDPEQAVTHALATVSATRYASVIATRASALRATLERDYPGSAAVAQLGQGLAELRTALPT
jgi:transcriptional regulator with XRE-family HTH domain